tara:strand:+ start:3076 stop:4053 length:978 start_codon:yes stop_codon:yes gene_type:complete
VKKIFVGLFFSIGGLYLAFGQIDFKNLSLVFSSVRWLPIIFASLAMVLSVWIRALRWRLILCPIKHLDTNSLFEATMIGYFGNSILPLRLGEFMRAYALKRNSLSISAAFGTIVIERTLDMIGIMILIILLFFSYDIPFWLLKSGLVVSIFVVIISLFLFWITLKHDQFIKKLIGFQFFRSGIRKKILDMIQSLMIGLTTLRKVKQIKVIVFNSLLLWGIYWLITFLCIYAVGIKLSFIQVGILMVAVTMIIILPAAPGFIGTYHAGAVLVLVEVFGVSQTSAQAYALINHAVGFIPLIVIGAFYFFRSSMTLEDIKSIKISSSS